MSREPSNTRERILEKAEDLVIRHGVSHLTLESAAAEAAISKGGVLYHFPTRAALVSAMVERFVVSFERDLVARGGRRGRPGDFSRAYLQATFSPTTTPGDPRELRLGGALLAGMASDPELLQPLRHRYDSWQESLEHDGISAATATVVRLASDGLWLSDLFGLAPVAGELRESVAALLAELVAKSMPAGSQ